MGATMFLNKGHRMKIGNCLLKCSTCVSIFFFDVVRLGFSSLFGASAPIKYKLITHGSALVFDLLNLSHQFSSNHLVRYILQTSCLNITSVFHVVQLTDHIYSDVHLLWRCTFDSPDHVFGIKVR